MSEGQNRLKILYWSFFILTIIAVLYIRIRLLGIPLERDEGEYAYMGQLISQGIIPYKDAYSMKLPGSAFMYYLIMSVFGQTITGIHLGLMAINFGVLPALFLLIKRLFNERTALVASASYAALSVGVPVLGFVAHATQFVVFFAVWGIYFLYKATDEKKTWLLAMSGLCLGMAFLMKQHGIFFLLFGVVYLFAIRRGLKSFVIECLVLVVMAALPFALTLLIIYRGGIFDTFWFWCFTYSGKYVSTLTLKDGVSRFTTMALRTAEHFTVLWISGISGLALMFSGSGIDRERRLFTLLFFLFSFLSLLPGFYFREHYFVLIIPAISIMAAYCEHYLSGVLARKFPEGILDKLPLAILSAGLIFTFTVQGRMYFKMPPDEVSREIYGLNPFVESPKIAQYLKQHAKEGDTVAVIGSEPQILFYSGIRSATGYIYMYGLMEDQPYNLQMQKAMAAGIEKAKPAFAVLVQVPASWVPSKNSPQYIFNWASAYIGNNYDITGVVDLIYYDNVVYKFGTDALNYKPLSNTYIYILMRKGGG
ncbi:MAG: glycosyltransferase family 39 protein [Nitrospirae bacterium]|nr:glycosyltransferase family 39 protein [Nitrospirota bacterium]